VRRVDIKLSHVSDFCEGKRGMLGKPDKRNIRGHRISSNPLSGLGTRDCTENSIRANQVYCQLYRMNYAMIRRLTQGVLRMLRLCSGTLSFGSDMLILSSG
jgi:hypothetical protein